MWPSGELLGGLPLGSTAKLKTPRPSHAQQNSAAVATFSERLSWKLRSAAHIAPDLHIRYWVEDESRFGLKPIYSNPRIDLVSQ